MNWLRRITRKEGYPLRKAPQKNSKGYLFTLKEFKDGFQIMKIKSITISDCCKNGEIPSKGNLSFKLITKSECIEKHNLAWPTKNILYSEKDVIYISKDMFPGIVISSVDCKSIASPFTLSINGVKEWKGIQKNAENVFLKETIIPIGAFRNSLVKEIYTQEIFDMGIGGCEGCYYLTTFDWPDNVKTIPACFFQGCFNLDISKILCNVTSLDSFSLSGCRTDVFDLTNIFFCSSYAFSGLKCHTLIWSNHMHKITSLDVFADVATGFNYVTAIEPGAFEGACIHRLDLSDAKVNELSNLSWYEEGSEIEEIVWPVACKHMKKDVFNFIRNLKHIFFNDQDFLSVEKGTLSKIVNTLYSIDFSPIMSLCITSDNIDSLSNANIPVSFSYYVTVL